MKRFAGLTLAAAFAGASLAGCGSTSLESAPGAQQQSKAIEEAPPAMKCGAQVGIVDDRAEAPDSGPATAKELGQRYADENETVQIVGDGDMATIYVLNEDGTEAVAKITAFQGAGGWYPDSVVECE